MPESQLNNVTTLDENHIFILLTGPYRVLFTHYDRNYEMFTVCVRVCDYYFAQPLSGMFSRCTTLHVCTALLSVL